MKLTQDEKLKIAEYCKENQEKPNRIIAEELGRCINTIKKIRKMYGVEYIQPTKLGADYRRDFIINNMDVMSKQRMARELNIAVSTVTCIMWKWKKEQGIEIETNTSLAKCWDCRKATDFARCVWVDRFEVPEGAECDNGTITKCPYFEKDELTEDEYWERKRNDKHKQTQK